MSRLVMSPILGFWSDKRPTREPLVVSFIVSLVANIAYIYASALPSGGQYVVLVARIVLGGCAGEQKLHMYTCTFDNMKHCVELQYMCNGVHGN